MTQHYGNYENTTAPNSSFSSENDVFLPVVEGGRRGSSINVEFNDNLFVGANLKLLHVKSLTLLLCFVFKG